MKNWVIFSAALLALLPISAGAVAVINSPTANDTMEVQIKTEPAVQTRYAKCGVNTFSVNDECGLNAYKTVFYACYDGYSEKQGGEGSCKPSETWQKYAEAACAGHCNEGYIPHTQTVPAVSPDAASGGSTGVPARTIVGTTATAPRPVDVSVTESIPSANNAGGVSACAQLVQWQKKVAYYEKLAELSEEELKNTNGFNKQEIQKILVELKTGAEKVSAACAKPTAQNVEIKPVVVESGEEIANYYNARLGKIQLDSSQGYDEKIQTLKDEAAELMTNFIKSRNEIEASELKSVVEEVKVSYGAITAGAAAVPTVAKKILVNTDSGAVAIQPTANAVIISDKNINVTAPEITIKEDKILVNDIEVKLTASAAAEKLNIVPQAVELKLQNDKAVYNMAVEEKRKLFGLIPLSINKTMVVDSADGSLVSEKKPWYSFLTSADK